MGMFHEKLGEAKEDLRKGKSNEAVKIIEKHIKELDELFPEIAALQEGLTEYARLVKDSKNLVVANREEEAIKQLKEAVVVTKGMEVISYKLFKGLKKEE